MFRKYLVGPSSEPYHLTGKKFMDHKSLFYLTFIWNNFCSDKYLQSWSGGDRKNAPLFFAGSKNNWRGSSKFQKIPQNKIT
jgi:hypothetical protein